MTVMLDPTSRVCADCYALESDSEDFEFQDCQWDSCEGVFCSECYPLHFDLFQSVE